MCLYNKQKEKIYQNDSTHVIVTVFLLFLFFLEQCQSHTQKNKEKFEKTRSEHLI
jgi:hypothetical protein